MAGDAALLEDERHDLVRENVHGVHSRLYVFNPSSLRQAEEGDRLQQGLGAQAEERAVRTRMRTASGSAEALQKRRDRRRRINLDDLVEVSDVDSQFHR